MGVARVDCGSMRTFAEPGEAVLLDPLVPAGSDRGAWAQRRAEIATRWEAVLGPDTGEVPLEPERGLVARNDAYTTFRLSYAAAHGDRVPALLLVPPGTGLPAVLALHQTVAQGKYEPVGIEGDPELAYADELARRGYVVLAPDEFVAGERPAGRAYHSADFDARFPEWSGAGKMLHDHRQAISMLASLPEVDARRLGAIGHSLGGINSGWLLGADERLRAAVVSCGFCTFAGDPRPLRWAAEDWFQYFHWLRDDLAHRCAPFEHHEVFALAAPRPMFWWATKADYIFPHWVGAAAAAEHVRAVYRLLGAEDRLEFRLGDGGHGFPRYVRLAAYAFLDRWMAAPRSDEEKRD
jgi:dienelactone hydrolase